MTSTDNLIARLRDEAWNNRNPIMAQVEFTRAADRLAALQDRVNELEEALQNALAAGLPDVVAQSTHAVLAKGEKG